MSTTEECPRCFDLGRTADDDKYDRECSCRYLARIAELESALKGHALAKTLGAEYRGKVSTEGGTFGAMQTLGEVQALQGRAPATPETWTPLDRVLVLERTLRSLLDSMGDFVRQSMHMSPEWRSGIEAAEQALLNSMRAGQPERGALKTAVEDALGYLPTTHLKGCKLLADRECGFCDCGYEAGINLRKLL